MAINFFSLFQTKFQQSQSYLLPQHSTLQNQQNPDRAAIFGGPKTTQNQDYSRFVFNFFQCIIENPDSYLCYVQVILFEINCAILYANLHELFCQFIC